MHEHTLELVSERDGNSIHLMAVFVDGVQTTLSRLNENNGRIPTLRELETGYDLIRTEYEKEK